MLLSVRSFGAIVENINPTKMTVYYALEGSKVIIRQCPGLPSSALDPSKCERIRSNWFSFSPIELKDFQDKIQTWTQADLQKSKAIIVDYNKQLALRESQLSEVEGIINGLPSNSPALSDYHDRRKDLMRQIEGLNAAITTENSKFEGMSLLFGEKGYLAQDIIHPVSWGEETYLSVRPYVSHFLDVFKSPNSDPQGPIVEAKEDFLRFKKQGLRPYCAFLSGGYGDKTEFDSHQEGNVRTIVSLDKLATFSEATKLCQAAGMHVAYAARIPGYHSHLWPSQNEEETWPVKKSTKLFAATELAKGLPNFDYMGGKLKIFWVQNWYQHRTSDADGFFMSPDGSWFRFDDGEEQGGIVAARKLPVDPNWKLSVVCEKQYPTLPRFIDKAELPECTEYVGWP